MINNIPANVAEATSPRGFALMRVGGGGGREPPMKADRAEEVKRRTGLTGPAALRSDER